MTASPQLFASQFVARTRILTETTDIAPFAPLRLREAGLTVWTASKHTPSTAPAAVLVEPDPSAVPFDLGGYRRDVLASKGDEHRIVAVRDHGTRLSVDRFQELAEAIGSHKGWHFILATSDDLNPGGFRGKPCSSPGPVA